MFKAMINSPYTMPNSDLVSTGLNNSGYNWIWSKWGWIWLKS